jgi:hypothetical protein
MPKKRVSFKCDLHTFQAFFLVKYAGLESEEVIDKTGIALR